MAAPFFGLARRGNLGLLQQKGRSLKSICASGL